MGQSRKSVVSPVQMLQTPVEEGCSNKRKQYTEEDFMHVFEEVYLDSDFDEEEDDLRHAKLMKKFQKYEDAAIAERKKANSEINIDRPVATDMGPGDQPKKIRGKKKKKKKNQKVCIELEFSHRSGSRFLGCGCWLSLGVAFSFSVRSGAYGGVGGGGSRFADLGCLQWWPTFWSGRGGGCGSRWFGGFCFSSGGGFCRGEGGEVLWYCLSWLWCFCPVVLERLIIVKLQVHSLVAFDIKLSKVGTS
ncbi:hypothetical protein QL285_024434 [Trifolium repens]|nr:hypothetical protein QL285_024434 [Trifolium repens]